MSSFLLGSQFQSTEKTSATIIESMQSQTNRKDESKKISKRRHTEFELSDSQQIDIGSNDIDELAPPRKRKQTHFSGVGKWFFVAVLIVYKRIRGCISNVIFFQ